MNIRWFFPFIMMLFTTLSYGQLTITDYKQIYNRVDVIMNSYVLNSSFSEPKGFKWSSDQERDFNKLFLNSNAMIYDDINASYLSELRPYELSDVTLIKYTTSLKQSFPNGIRATITNIHIQYDQLKSIVKIPNKNTEFSLDVLVRRKVEGTNLTGASFMNDDTLRISIGMVLDVGNLLLEDRSLIKSITKIGESFTVINDEDQDGAFDGEDDCPHERGPKGSKGCPDDDGDGTPNRLDHCRYTRGSKNNSGCPLNYYSTAMEISGVAGVTFNNMHMTNELENNYELWHEGEAKGYSTTLNETKINSSGFKGSLISTGVDLNYFFKNTKKTSIGEKELSRSIGIGAGIKYTRFELGFSLDGLTVAYKDEASDDSIIDGNGKIYYEKVARYQRIRSVDEVMTFDDVTIDIHLAFRKKIFDGKIGIAGTLGPVFSILNGKSDYSGYVDFGEISQFNEDNITDWDTTFSNENKWEENTYHYYHELMGYDDTLIKPYFEKLNKKHYANVGLNTCVYGNPKIKQQIGYGASGSIAVSYFFRKASTIGINFLFNAVWYKKNDTGNYKIINKRTDDGGGYNPLFNGNSKIDNYRIGINVSYTLTF